MNKYKNISQNELIAMSQKNDLKALGELLKRIQKDVFASFCYLCRDTESVPDLTQEVLFKLSENISSLNNPKSFKIWLNKIIINSFRDETRKKLKIPKTVDINENICNVCTESALKPFEKIFFKQTEELIKKEILKLEENYRIAIVLREFEGLSYEEISKITNTNIGTVKSRIARGRERLHEHLKDKLAED